LPDFYQARDKHYQWLGRLRQVLDNKASIAIEQAGSHTECALGRWLHGDGLKGYTDIAELHSLEEAHRHFHGLVHDVVVSKVNGNQRQAEQAFGRVAQASLKVIELLTTVERRTIELRNINIVVLQAGDRQFGLVVDGIHDTEEIVVKPLRKQLKSIKTFAGASIMGDGRVALILDVMGLAQRAGVIAELKEKLAGESAEQLQQAAGGKQRFLLFAGPGESRMAVPLETVARLEELPRAQVEKTGQQWVTQYRGKILPLVNLALVLEERRRKPRPAESAADFRDGPLQMLVCNHQGATAGIVVEKILDIVEDAAQVQHPASRAGVLYSAVIAGHVTELLDVPAILAAAGVSIEPEMSAAEATQ
jgi:chemotaxis protein histidine kinase CheA